MQLSALVCVGLGTPSPLGVGLTPRMPQGEWSVRTAGQFGPEAQYAVDATLGRHAVGLQHQGGAGASLPPRSSLFRRHFLNYLLVDRSDAGSTTPPAFHVRCAKRISQSHHFQRATDTNTNTKIYTTIFYDPLPPQTLGSCIRGVRVNRASWVTGASWTSVTHACSTRIAASNSSRCYQPPSPSHTHTYTHNTRVRSRVATDTRRW